MRKYPYHVNIFVQLMMLDHGRLAVHMRRMTLELANARILSIDLDRTHFVEISNCMLFQQ